MSGAQDRAVGRRTSGLYVVLTPDLTIVDASEAYLRATLLWRDDIRGCQLFDVFPDNPADMNADGVRNLRASLDRVLRSGTPDRMPLQRYDVRDRLGEEETWIEKFWTPLNTPLFGSGSREITHLLHEVEDVTEAVSLRTTLEEEKVILAEQRATVRRMREDLRRREHELREIDGRLVTVLAGEQPPKPFVDRVRKHLRIPERQRYWSPGEIAPETAAYAVFHQRACHLGLRSLYIRAGGVFRSCPHCGEAILYQVRRDNSRRGHA